MSEDLDSSKFDDESVDVVAIWATPADIRKVDALIKLYNLPDREPLLLTAMSVMYSMQQFLSEGFIPTAHDPESGEHVKFIHPLFNPFMPQYKKEIDEVVNQLAREKMAEDNDAELLIELEMGQEEIAEREGIIRGFKARDLGEIISGAIGFVNFLSKQKPSFVPAMLREGEDEDGIVVFDFPELKREPADKMAEPTRQVRDDASQILYRHMLAGGSDGIKGGPQG